MRTISRIRQFSIAFLLLSLFAQDALAQVTSGRLRIYDAFGNQQGSNIDTIGAGRIVSTTSGFVVIDDGDRRLRIYNVFGVLQNRAIRTSGAAGVVPAGNLLAIIDDSRVQIYTLFGRPQGASIRTGRRADVVPVGSVFVVVEENIARIFNLFGVQIGRSILTNERARVVHSDARFALIDAGRVRMFDLAGNPVGSTILTIGVGEAVVTRNDVFVVTDDTRVRLFNVLGGPIGAPILTTARASIALTTDRIVVIDTRVRIYQERTGILVKQIATRGQARVVTSAFRVAIIDNGDRRVRIFDSEGNLPRGELRTTSRTDVVITSSNRLVIIDDDRVRILDPFGSTLNDAIRTSGRADIASATDKIFIVDDTAVRMFDHFGVSRGRTFSTSGRAETVTNITAIAIHDPGRVRIYNHLRDVDAGTVATRGDVALATSIDRIAILDGQDEPIAGLIARNDSPTTLGNVTTLLASISAGAAVSYSWDFGDGTTGTGETVTHIYAAAGLYTATVTASNSINSATATTIVTVIPFALEDDARFIAQVVPSRMRPGETATVSITMENTGTSTWTAGTDYMLGSENPQDNTLWTGSTRIMLTPFDAIEPGERKTFTFEITAPTVPGRYNFQWRMLQEANPDREREQKWFGSFTANAIIIVAAAPGVPPWEDDAFDSLRRGSLHGQNGWRRAARNRASAVVKPAPAGGNLLVVNPRSGTTIVMGKNVADQASGRHLFSFHVRVSAATTPSIAKIEMQTPRNLGWDKKFQIYFSDSMRLNYGRDSRAVVFLAPTEMGRWYSVECLMNLDTGIVDIRLDGIPVATGIPMHPGPISSIALSGWDRPGSVKLDDLLGTRIE